MITIYLARLAKDSRVLLDGVDISDHVRGVTVNAHVGAITEVVLRLSDEVAIEGDPLVVLQAVNGGLILSPEECKFLRRMTREPLIATGSPAVGELLEFFRDLASHLPSEINP